MSRITVWSVAALLVALGASAHAQDGRTFVISDDAGYGISGCFGPGVACGKSVADTWCSSQGRGPALSFGLASDITASLVSERSAKVDPNAIVITCGD